MASIRHHTTIDVLAPGDSSLVISSTDVEPAEAVGQMDAALGAGLEGLRQHLEG